MLNFGRDEYRLQRLRVAVKLLLWVAFVAILFVSFAHFGIQTSSKEGKPDFGYDLSSVGVGSMVAFLWNGQPMLIYRRTPAEIASLQFRDSNLFDPGSTRSQQPEFARNAARSLKPEWFVAYNRGTDFGCTLAYKSETRSDQPSDDDGTPYLEDTCRHSRYDLAGRVFTGFYATKNLSVPDYHIAGDTLILKSD